MAEIFSRDVPIEDAIAEILVSRLLRCVVL